MVTKDPLIANKSQDIKNYIDLQLKIRIST